MSEPYLILHKVRGEPTFDIAIKIIARCEDVSTDCEEMWIIPTSGHRAYPYRKWELSELADVSDINSFSAHDRPYYRDEIPNDWPDHYATNDRPVKEETYVVNQRAKGLLEGLGLVK